MVKKPLNSLTPAVGMTVQVYLSDHTTVGSGTRTYVIIGLSPRYLTLFYVPRLLAIKIKKKNWPMRPAAEYKPDLEKLVALVEYNRGQFQEHQWRFNAANVERTLKVLRQRIAKEKANAVPC